MPAQRGSEREEERQVYERGQGGRKSRKKQTDTIAYKKKKKSAAFGFGMWPVTTTRMFGTH